MFRNKAARPSISALRVGLRNTAEHAHEANFAPSAPRPVVTPLRYFSFCFFLFFLGGSPVPSSAGCFACFACFAFFFFDVLPSNCHQAVGAPSLPVQPDRAVGHPLETGHRRDATPRIRLNRRARRAPTDRPTLTQRAGQQGGWQE